jgi:hypothetical protein
LGLLEEILEPYAPESKLIFVSTSL